MREIDRWYAHVIYLFFLQTSDSEEREKEEGEKERERDREKESNLGHFLLPLQLNEQSESRV